MHSYTRLPQTKYTIVCMYVIIYVCFHCCMRQVTSIAAKHLFHLNAKTKDAVRELQSKHDYHYHHYPLLLSDEAGYLSLQLRMTDKVFEMSAATWNWIANSSNVVREMEPFFKDLNISQLYIGNTDNSHTKLIYKYTYQPTYLSTYNSFTHPSINLPTYISTYLPKLLTYLPTHLPTYSC